MVKANAGIAKAADLNGQKIAVAANTSNESALADLVKQGKLKATLLPVPDRNAGIAALEKGEADAYASDKLLLVGARFQDAKALMMLPDDLSFEPYAIALPRGDWAFRLAVNTALAEVFRSGLIFTVFGKWFDQIKLKPGPVLLSALIAQDMYLAGTIVLMLGALTVIGTFISDLVLMWIEPRIRHQVDQ